MSDNKSDIDKLKEHIFKTNLPQFSTILPDNPDIVNYDRDKSKLIIVINDINHEITGVSPQEFLQYSEFLHSKGKFILR